MLLLLGVVFLHASAGPLRRVPQQYRTIQSAIDAAKAGDTVLIDHGTYYENIRINKNIVVASRVILDNDLLHRSRTIIDGSRARDKRRGSTITISGPCDTNCVVIGLTVRGGTGTILKYAESTSFRLWIAGGGILVRNAGARIVLNHLTENHPVSRDTIQYVFGGGLSAGVEAGKQSLFPLLIIERNLITDNNVTGSRAESGGIAVLQPAIIRDNVILRNRSRSRGRGSAGGIGAYFVRSYDIRIERNIIRDNAAGIAGGINVGAPGHSAPQRGRAIIANNIIADNSVIEVGGAVNLDPGSFAILTNNTIVGNHAGAKGSVIHVGRSASGVLVNNIAWENGPDPVSSQNDVQLLNNLIDDDRTGWHNVSVDPLFVPGDTLFRLAPESPVIGLGEDSVVIAGVKYSLLTNDLLGQPRPPGRRPDLGAIEHPAVVSEASSRIRRSWETLGDRRLKLFAVMRQTTPTKLSDDRIEAVGAGHMRFTMTVNDTGTIELSDPKRIPTYELPPGQNLVQIELVPRGMDGTRTLSIYLRLNGYEHITRGMPSQAYGFQQYANLAPREYLLRLGAADQAGLMDGANWRSVRIIVPPYWYQRWWAYALLVAVIAGIIAFVAIREIVRLRREKQLQQEFTKKQLEFQESEHNRLASELHDGLGQSLLVIKNELQQIQEEPAISRDDLNRITALADDALETAREISSNLHPHHIEYLGFSAAVDALAQNVAQSSGVRMLYSCDTGDAVLPKEAEVHLYRIIQEGLSNIVRHAGARNVRVQLRKHQESFEVIISDDGHGFDVGEFTRDHKRKISPDLGRGFGLASMAERARIIGGMLTINSSANSGTTIHLVLPAMERTR